MEDLSPINAYRRAASTPGSRRLSRSDLDAASHYESKRSSPTRSPSRRSLRSADFEEVDSVEADAAEVLPSDQGSVYSSVEEETPKFSTAHRHLSGFGDVVTTAKGNLVRSLNSRLDLLSSKQVVNLHNQVNQLQKRLKNSYACLRESERVQEELECKNRDLNDELEDLRQALDEERLKTAAAQRNAVLIKERSTAVRILLRAFHGWSRRARLQAEHRRERLHRLVAISELHAVAVQRRAFDIWGETVNLATLGNEHDQRTARLRSCLLRLWVRGGQAHRQSRIARAFSRWKRCANLTNLRIVHGQALLRIVRSTFHGDSVARKRAAVSRAFTKWAKMTYSGGFEAVRAAARLVAARLHARARISMRRGFDTLRLACAEQAVRTEYESESLFRS